MAEKEDLLKQVLEARTKVATADEALKAAKQLKKEAEEKLIERMDEDNEKSFRNMTFSCTVVQKTQLYAGIQKDNRDEAVRWIEEECGRADIVKKNVHHKTLSTFVGDLMKEGTPIPVELITTHYQTGLTISFGK